MNHWFQVGHLDIDRLLAEWRWLYPNQARLVARNAFGDIFIADETGQIMRIDVAVGKLEVVAASEVQFREFAQNTENRESWFAESDEQRFSAKGLIPDKTQCIAFDIPLVFADSGKTGKPYIADVYEQVSFLGDVNRQIKDMPDGGKVSLKIKP